MELFIKRMCKVYSSLDKLNLLSHTKELEHNSSHQHIM